MFRSGNEAVRRVQMYAPPKRFDHARTTESIAYNLSCGPLTFIWCDDIFVQANPGRNHGRSVENPGVLLRSDSRLRRRKPLLGQRHGGKPQFA